MENPTDIADDILALEAFDKPPLQIELEVVIYEIDDGDKGKLGLDWDSWKRFTTGEMTYSASDEDFILDPETDVFTTMLTLDARALADFLNYTVQSGTTEVLTSTKVTMVNSEDQPGALAGGARGTATGDPAVIESITVIPYTTVQADVGGTNSTNARNEIWDSTFEGVRVEILPFIATESITLKVHATVNSMVGYSKDTDAPLIATRNLNSVVNLKDGMPIILGGLEKSSEVKSRVGFPLLKDIPLLQYVFSKESKSNTSSKVLIQLTPKIKGAEDETETIAGMM